ncbi:MAG: MmcQ/YjbR family DNA-binding protein, partial [Abditibacteriota bacterium]|nr:MmcQ/YjbR family DNA-binding protein [Abditibacteriota bacterium]
MTSRKEVTEFALSLGEVYEDYTFHDSNWQLFRLRKNRKAFAFVYERKGCLQINVKCLPAMAELWREGFEAVIPAYHMNKKHWNTIILDGSVPEDAVKQMIEESF